MKTHSNIGDPIIVIIVVTFITQAIFVVIFLARVGKVRAVILTRKQKKVLSENHPKHRVQMAKMIVIKVSVHVGSSYLFAMIRGVCHAL